MIYSSKASTHYRILMTKLLFWSTSIYALHFFISFLSGTLNINRNLSSKIPGFTENKEES